MQLCSRWRLVLASVATAAMAIASLDSLPKYPDKVSWPPAVSWLAFASALAMLLLWFLIIAWLTERASSYKVLYRIVLYPTIALLGSAAFLAPLLLTTVVLGVCRFALDCSENAQGFFNVLSVVARHLSVEWSFLASIALVAATAAVARRLCKGAHLAVAGVERKVHGDA